MTISSVGINFSQEEQRRPDFQGRVLDPAIQAIKDDLEHKECTHWIKPVFKNNVLTSYGFKV